MPAHVSREIRLKHRPVGLQTEDDFELVTVPIPALHQGEMLVCNLYMSVDPYMRGRMYDQASYVEPFQIGQPLYGGCVGQMVQSETASFQVGDYVSSRQGWRECFVSDGTDLTKIDTTRVPVQAYLGTVGMPGLTAYVGLLDIGKPKVGGTVFVSAAAGAVGAVVCQIAKITGMGIYNPRRAAVSCISSSQLGLAALPGVCRFPAH